MNKNLIPKGCYCYYGSHKCPYFSYLTLYDSKGNIDIPYCLYLKLGSHPIGGWNNDEFKRLQILLGQTEDELWFNDGLLSLDLLWDQVKECGINFEDDLENQI